MRLEYTPISVSETAIQLYHEFYSIDGVIEPADLWLADEYMRGFGFTKEMLGILDEQLIRSLKNFELSIYEMTLLIDLRSGGSEVNEDTWVYGDGFSVFCDGWYHPEVMRSRVEVVAVWLSAKLRGRQPAFLTKAEVQELAGYDEDVPGRNGLWDELKALYLEDHRT